MEQISIAILGATGRMGRLLCAETLNAADLALVAAVVQPSSGQLGQDIGTIIGAGVTGIACLDEADSALKLCDVAIDFTTPSAALNHARLAAEHKKPLVIGTTGLNDAEQSQLKSMAAHAPIFYAPNMSIGVYVMQQLLQQAAWLLDPSYEMEIVEAHHNKKADAPSGTALAMAKTMAGARGIKFPEQATFGRHGHTGARPNDQIGIHTVRMGGVIGDHSAHFANDMERIEISHRAIDRKLFVRGALSAARWISAQKPGLYGMADMVKSGTVRQA